MSREIFAASQLTESQRRAVLHREGPLLVLAGPGSGKTRVITSRIAALIESGVKPWHICAITFTNKAAEEMRERVASSTTAQGVRTSTFHSLCVWILRVYAEQAGLAKNFSIYDTSDQKRCVKQAVKACHADVSNFAPAKMLGAISNYKNNLSDPEYAAETADNFYVKTVAKIYDSYQKILAKNNALDFDDLLVKTAFLLRDFGDVRSELNRRFQYLLVDEYQDTNHAQYQIAKGLALDHRNICVTGDPDQSIYRWRGADISNILEFEKDWPEAVVVKLEENFRSTPNILKIADKLIAKNTQRKDKKLIATLAAGEDVCFDAYDDEGDEAEDVAKKVRLAMGEGCDPNEIAVFYRVNSMSRAIEEAFIEEQIPYQVVRGVEFYSRKEIRDLISYLKIVANPDDDVALVRAIGTHSRGIGKTTVDRVVAYAGRQGISLYTAMSEAGKIESLSKAGQGKLLVFAKMIESFKKEAGGAVAPLMEYVFEETGLQLVMRKAGEKLEAAMENIGELINSAAKYDRQSAEPNLLDYLQSIALYSDTDAYDGESGKVSLMTLHAAKGLEFENAFIIGLEEGILPHERSLHVGPEELEEERRLFFVGITRAKLMLNVSYARYRTLRGQYLRTIPSQFLYEVGYDASDNDSQMDFQADVFGKKNTSAGLGVQKPGAAYVRGELVRHGKFGLGRIKEFHDLGANSIVVVSFNSGKVKSLMMAYANLEKL